MAGLARGGDDAVEDGGYLVDCGPVGGAGAPGLVEEAAQVGMPSRGEVGPETLAANAELKFLGVHADEGLAHDEEFPGDDGERVAVGLEAVFLAHRDLWGHVAQGAGLRGEVVDEIVRSRVGGGGALRLVVVLDEFVVGEADGEAEVEELDALAVLDEADVLGLEVAVDDVAVVEVGERVEEYSDEVSSLLLVVERLLHDPLEQLAALHQLDDHVVHFLLLVKVVQLDDVRVLDRPEHRDLLLQARDVLRLELGRLRDALDRDREARGPVRHPPRALDHLGERPRPELLPVVQRVRLAELAVAVDVPPDLAALDRRAPANSHPDKPERAFLSRNTTRSETSAARGVSEGGQTPGEAFLCLPSPARPLFGSVERAVEFDSACGQTDRERGHDL
mmetsp:Transcript_6694/g.20372  ORF Transcript_6694/g.20372 Transcript_6694/m.20372 type:complete len:392 (+) Transcript_6694:375-1550(+)